MSSSLHWKRPPIPVKEHTLNLKYEIAQFYDPEWNGLSVPEWRAGKELIPFLQGVKAMTNESSILQECDELIAAIQTYGEIVMWIS